jgi:endoribonuclease Dicer
MENTADSSPEARVMLSANPVSTHASSLLSSPSKANDLKGDDAKEVALLDSDTDEEDDQYILVENERRRPKVTERSRLNAAIFQKWLDNHQNEVTKPNAQRRPGDLDSHSIAQLLGEFSNEKIITSPREYQIELFEKAKEKNIIVVLDTGTNRPIAHNLEEILTCFRFW